VGAKARLVRIHLRKRPVKGKYCRPQSEIPLFLKKREETAIASTASLEFSLHPSLKRRENRNFLPFVRGDTEGFTHRAFQPVT
jgi:hypothetical protein